MAKGTGGAAPDGCRVVVLGGSKGGCGRSTIARNLLVAAGQAGIRTVGIDLDTQRTLRKWSDRRSVTREKLPQVVATEVIASHVDQWPAILADVAGYRLAIVDTAPGVEHNLTDILALCREAALVLVPTSPSTDDLESVVPWFRSLVESGATGAFVLNKANRRTKSFGAARSALLRHGPVAPVEIPQLEDIAAPFATGLAVLDYDRARGADVMGDIWRYVQREVRL
jgi:chromosome partitioning protein